MSDQEKPGRASPPACASCASLSELVAKDKEWAASMDRLGAKMIELQHENTQATERVCALEAVIKSVMKGLEHAETTRECDAFYQLEDAMKESTQEGDK